MFRNHQLRSRIAVAGAVVGASMGTVAISGAAAATPAPVLPSLTQVVTGLSKLHLSPASLTTASRDYRLLQTRAASPTPGYGGLGSLLQALSQVNGIKGTQFGDDLSSLATDFSNEDGVSYTNYVDGLHKLQTESSAYPAPFNELFYNLAAALLKDAQASSPSGASPAATSTSTSTSTSSISLTGILKSL